MPHACHSPRQQPTQSNRSKPSRWAGPLPTAHPKPQRRGAITKSASVPDRVSRGCTGRHPTAGHWHGTHNHPRETTSTAAPHTPEHPWSAPERRRWQGTCTGAHARISVTGRRQRTAHTPHAHTGALWTGDAAMPADPVRTSRLTACICPPPPPPHNFCGSLPIAAARKLRTRRGPAFVGFERAAHRARPEMTIEMHRRSLGAHQAPIRRPLVGH